LNVRSRNNAAVSTVIFGVVVVVVLIVAAAGGYFAGTASGSKTVTNTTTVAGSGATVTTTQTVTTTAGVTPSATSNVSFTIGVSHFTTPPSAPMAYLVQNNKTLQTPYLPNVKIEQFASGTTGIVQGLESNAIQMGVGATDSMLAAIAKGVPITIVGSWESSPTVQAIFASSSSSYTNLASTKGATFAVTGATSLSGTIAKILAGEQGWTSTQYTLSPVGSTNAILAAVSQSPTTVGVLDPYVAALATPNYKIIGLVNESWPLMSIVATNTFISQNPGAIKAAIAMFSGPNQLFDSNPGGVAQNFMHTYPLYNMTTQQYQFFMSFSQWSPDGSMHTLEYQQAINTLFTYGVMTQNITLSQALNTQFVPTFP
jgi:ABC-type nitrate/sulfonate/bicarbonate transport system substrate-binding protein